MANKTNILLIGATGYVGGTFLLRLLDHAQVANFAITVLVRSAEKAKKLGALNLGIDVVEGSPTVDADFPVLEKVVEGIDVVNSDDEVGATNLLKALRNKYTTSGQPTRVVHMSGAAVCADDAWGKDVPHAIYDDADVNQMAAFPDTAYHRQVDLKLLKADEEGYITSYLVIPGVIYGLPSNNLVDAGIQKENAIQPRIMIGPVLALGGVPASVGGGYNKWSVVDYEDCADLCVVIFDHLISSTWVDVPHGPDGYYFAENGEVEIRKEVEIAARTLASIRGGDAPEPRALTEEEVKKFIPYTHLLASNCVCRGTRGRKLGWKPKKEVKDFVKDIEIFTKYVMNTSS
ncbi:NAD(P)-binding protein [Hymenopellis radicata]|nr:NAD(P)-binding protein [Hymenopellis radicata]